MYLDPGFGGMLVQIIAAIVVIGSTLFFALRKKIVGLFTKNNKKAANSMPAAESRTANGDKTSDDVIDTLSDE